MMQMHILAGPYFTEDLREYWRSKFLTRNFGVTTKAKQSYWPI